MIPARPQMRDGVGARSHGLGLDGRKFAGVGLYYFEKDAHDILPDEEGEGR